jgi:hypothetical protein
MRAVMQPEPVLTVSGQQWHSLCQELARRTEGYHESGAFLLGAIDSDGRRTLRQVVYYDDLDPAAYDSGVCVLHADSFGPLWEICRKAGLQIVADIHVHPFGAGQSYADKTNPMVAQRGHLALILPNFARPPINLAAVGFYEYHGAHQWRELGGRSMSRHFQIGA